MQPATAGAPRRCPVQAGFYLRRRHGGEHGADQLGEGHEVEHPLRRPDGAPGGCKGRCFVVGGHVRRLPSGELCMPCRGSTDGGDQWLDPCASSSFCIIHAWTTAADAVARDHSIRHDPEQGRVVSGRKGGPLPSAAVVHFSREVPCRVPRRDWGRGPPPAERPQVRPRPSPHRHMETQGRSCIVTGASSPTAAGVVAGAGVST